MEKTKISKDFTIEDIHKLREYNYQVTKQMTVEERKEYYNTKGQELHKLLLEKKKE